MNSLAGQPRHGASKWRPRLRTAGAFALIAVFVALAVAPTIQARVNITEVAESTLYVEPARPELYGEAVGSGLELQIGGSDDGAWRVSGVERYIYISAYAVLLTAVSSTLPEWTLHLPSSTLAVRSAQPPTSFDRESQLWVWGNWVEVRPSSEPEYHFAPVVLERPDTDVAAHVIDLELKLAIPAYGRPLSDWRWLESASLNWEPNVAANAEWSGWDGLQYSEGRIMTAQDARDIMLADDPADVIAQLRSGVTAPVLLRICRECEPLATYPDGGYTLNGQSDWHLGEYNRRLAFAWDTPWYPWFWLWLPVLSLIGSLFVGTVTWLVRQGLGIRSTVRRH
ncbi:hypothetical protein [uncultured Schumannella sp.]|uniref:hypothetical protein n=1 Tax=uncultured Schumannella sp. TaxID=1195956 RepID=UPI0025FFF513|nr:hypothetical protein [uncultured Schumannella sp.]